MKEYARISKQMGFSYFMQGLSFAIGLFLFAVLTRLLTKSDYGLYSIFGITLATLYRILVLGLNNFIIRDLPGRTTKEKEKKISAILNFSALFLLFLLGILFIIKQPLLKLFRLTSQSDIFQIVLYSVFFSVLLKYIASYLIANKKIIESKVLSFFSLEFWGVLVIIFALYKGDLLLKQVFLIRLLVVLSVFVFVSVYYYRNKINILRPFTPYFDYLRKALKFSLPLMPVGVIAWLIAMSDRYILAFFHGSIKVGIYSYAYSLFTFVLTAGTIISATLLPYISEAWNKKIKEKVNFLFNASIKYTLLVLFPAVAGIFVMKKEIITLISGTKYLLATPIIPILMFFPLFQLTSSIYQYSLMLKNRTKRIGLIYLIGFMFNIAFNFILIPRFHFYGASVATILTYILMFFLFYNYGKKLIRLDNRFIKIEKIISATLVMCAAIFFIHPQVIYTKLLVMGLGGAIYFIFLFLLKGFVKDEIDLIKFLFKGKKFRAFKRLKLSKVIK